jgi:4-methylaminobutanoate oxidase (formaldehyde-forming)
MKAEGTPKRRMLQFLLDDPEPLMHGNEIIRLDGKPVGYIQVGAYGHTLGAATGIGFAEADAPLTADRVDAGRWEIEIAGRTYAARASLKPMLDPTMERVKR